MIQEDQETALDSMERFARAILTKNPWALCGGGPGSIAMMPGGNTNLNGTNGNSRGTFTSQMSPSEAARYERYWQQQYHQHANGTRFRDQAPPGTRSIVDQKLSKETGEVYTRETIYDQFGRRIGNNDFTNHGRPDHTNPHHHTRDPITGRRGDACPGLHPQTPNPP